MSLSGWDNIKKLKLTIDGSKIDEDLTDFPVLITLSSGCGINSFDASCVFNELEVYPYEVCDIFTGVSGSIPNVNLWRIYDSPYIDICNNKLRFANVSDYCFARSEFGLSGDFNIQLDFEIINGPSTDSWAATLLVRMNSNYDAFLVRKAYVLDKHKYIINECVAGVWNDVGSSYNSTDMSGKLCIVRSGNTFSGYFWHSDGYWYNLGSKVYDVADGDIRYIELEHGGWDTNPSFSFYFDNFKVNNGTPYFLSRLAITTAVSGVETQCYTEIERWKQKDKIANLWTKIPTIVSGSDIELGLYYDKSHLNNWVYVDFIGTTAGKNVWDDNFMGVYHFEDLSGDVKDSTSNVNHGIANNLSTSERNVAGFIGNAFDFSGEEYVGLPDNTDFKPDYITIEAICITASGNPDWARIFDRYHHPSYGYALLVADTGKARFNLRITDNVYSDADTIAIIEGDGFWHYLAGSYENTKTRMYDNGVCDEIENTSSGVIIHEATEEPRIGDGVNDSSYLGQISEIRISNIARSGAWVKVTHYSNCDNLITYDQYKCCFSGIVNVEGKPAIRKVNLYNQDTGELINYTTSVSGTGEWLIDVYGDTINKYFAVCVPESDNRNAEVFANVTGI